MRTFTRYTVTDSSVDLLLSGCVMEGKWNFVVHTLSEILITFTLLIIIYLSSLYMAFMIALDIIMKYVLKTNNYP